LIVSGAQKSRQLLTAYMKAAGFGRILTAGTGAQVRGAAEPWDADVVLINAPLPDEYGDELALAVTAATEAAVILLVKDEQADEVADRVEDEGVLVIGKPINQTLMRQAIRLARAARKRVLGLRTENRKLQSKIEEVRLVDRAKCALIQYLSMTEPQAHHYIEKQAMDMRVTRREVAEGIIKTYEV
jgi:response regulator NasT